MSTREIDDRIAAALERLAWTDDPQQGIGVSLLRVAAELRAADFAIAAWKCQSCEFSCANPKHTHLDCFGRFPHTHDHAACVRPEPATQPSLVAVARKRAELESLDIGTVSLLCELADAIEAAQAVNVAAEKVVASMAVPGWAATADAIRALAATMERGK